jgi:hypothetical protein
MKAYRDIQTMSSPIAGSRFCGEERLNLARKGLCNASLATHLLSAMLSEVCMSRALP